MSFHLSDDVDPHKVFLAHWSELFLRFDPEMVRYQRETDDFKYPVRRLHELFRFFPQYGANEPGQERLSPDEPRYVRITDIDEHGNLTNELGATALNFEPRYELDENDLLIARSGNTVGKSYLHKKEFAPYPCFFAGYLIRFRFDSSVILPEYVFAFTQLPVYKAWVKAVQRRAGQPNINAQEYSSLEIPVPPLDIQAELVTRLNQAYGVKRERDRDVKQLLTSIDTLLLRELGITLPPEPPNSIEQRMFTRRFSEVTGGRFDPLSHQHDPFYFIRDSKYDLAPLASKVKYFLTGFAAGREDQGDETGIVQIRPTNISSDREFVFDRNIFIAAEQLEKRKADVLVRGEVLFNNTNSQEQVGKTVLFDLPGSYFCSNHITRIKVDRSGMDEKYLSYVLNLFQRKNAFFRTCVNWNNQSGIGTDVLSKAPIPIPNKDRQQEIVKDLDKVRSEAQKMRTRAKQELAKAKREIERLLLNETANDNQDNTDEDETTI